MKINKWLRKIFLFPFSILMAVPDGDGGSSSSTFDTSILSAIAGPPDLPPLNERIMAFIGEDDATMQILPSNNNPDTSTGKDAETSGQGTGLDGKQGDDGIDNGLDTASDEDDQGAGLGDEDDEIADDSTQLETDESEEGTKAKGKLTLGDRLAKMKQELQKEFDDKLEAELQKIKAQETSVKEPEFATPEVIRAVKMNIIKTRARIRELEGELELDGDDADPDKADEILRLEAYVSNAAGALQADSQAKAEWEKSKAAREQQAESSANVRAELDKAADLYRAEMKIDATTWDKMGAWFEQQINSKPLLVEEFNDVFNKHGKVAAIRFAHKYTVKNMGQKTKQAHEAKETNKTKTASVTAASAPGKAPVIDLAKAHKEFAESDDPVEAFARLQKLKRQAAGG
jgi:hypothetical protein